MSGLVALPPPRSASEAGGDRVGDAQRVGDDGQRRIDGTDRREKAGVGDIEIVDAMRLAVDVEHRGRRIAAEAQRAGLVRSAADRHVLAEIKRALEEMRMDVEAVQHLAQLLLEPPMRLEIG